MEIQSRKMDANTSQRITALRFLLIIFVVFMHNNFTVELIAEGVAKGGAEVLFNQGIFGRWLQLFISAGIARGAVPLFMLFAAYLQEIKNDPYPILLKKKTKSLFIPFILWSVFYIVSLNGLKLLLIHFFPSFVQHPDQTFLNWSAQDWFYSVFGYADCFDCEINQPMMVFQFWFLRDLIVLIIISPILRFAIRKYPIVFLCTIFFVHIMSLSVYFVETQALFYYSLGLYWGIYDIPLFEKIDKISWVESVLIFLFSFFLTWKFFFYNSTVYWLMVFAACQILLKLSSMIVAYEKVFKTASYFASFSFFLFAVHAPILQSAIQRIWLFFFPMKNQFFCIFEYFGVNILTILIGTGAGILLWKLCPRFFGLITGGRSKVSS